MSTNFHPDPDLTICFNCQHFGNYIALGQGLRCNHPAVRDGTSKPKLIPSRHHTCHAFERNSHIVSNAHLQLSASQLQAVTSQLEYWRHEARENETEGGSNSLNFLIGEPNRRIELVHTDAQGHSIIKIIED